MSATHYVLIAEKKTWLNRKECKFVQKNRKECNMEINESIIIK